MIYDIPVNDPRLRYQPRPTQPVKSYQQMSPRSLDRYARFRGQPVNLSRNVPAYGDLSNSNIYTKQGLLRRNQIGWDGVKLTQYVTQQLSQNYLENQRVLEKFRADAERNRRERKFKHAYQGRQPIESESIILPPIVVNETSRYANSPILSDPYIDQYEVVEEIPRYRNVGVNTNKYYEKVQLQKYFKLSNKYETLKEKYRRQKEYRRRQKRRFQEKQEERQREKASLQKIKDIQTELMNISVKLEASNSFLADKLAQQNRKRQMQMNHHEDLNDKQLTTRRLKTQPESEAGRKWQIPEDEGYQTVKIPENPLLKMKQDLKQNKKGQKSPTVVYSKKSGFVGSDFLSKYARQ